LTRIIKSFDRLTVGLCVEEPALAGERAPPKPAVSVVCLVLNCGVFAGPLSWSIWQMGEIFKDNESLMCWSV